MAYHKDALPRGEELADYVIESILGHGGFGITYLARDTNLGSDIALKEYLPQSIAGRNGATQILPNPGVNNAIKDYHWGLREFLKEAQSLAKFKHPNIVRVLRFLQANGTAYMAMEYEKGQSLSRILKDRQGRRLNEQELLKIFLPVLNGLTAVHAAGMLHLDIKPDNIYIREDGTPMLIDFGSARQAIIAADHAQKITLTHGFAPIEQYPDKGKQGPWTDLYALGASMYFCVTGKRPPVSVDRYQMFLKNAVDSMTPAVKAGEGVYPRYLLDCIDWALSIYPKDRPQSAQELQDGLLGRGRPFKGPKPKIAIPKEDERRSSAKKESSFSVTRFLVYTIIIAAIAGVGTFAAWPEIKQRFPQQARKVEKLLQPVAPYYRQLRGKLGV